MPTEYKYIQPSAAVDSLQVGTAGATTGLTTIPVKSITPNFEEGEVDTTNSTNYSSYMFAASQKTKIRYNFDIVTERYKASATTPVMLAAIQSVITAGSSANGSENIAAIVTQAGKTYTGDFAVYACKPGTNVDDAQVSFTLKSQGIITVGTAS